MIHADRRRVYVAGAYSFNTVLGVFDNMRIGIQTSSELFKKGFSPFCPWLDYHYSLSLPANNVSVEDYYRYSIDFLKVCDSVFVVNNPRNKNSVGLKKELELARELDIPIFTNVTELCFWAEK